MATTACVQTSVITPQPTYLQIRTSKLASRRIASMNQILVTLIRHGQTTGNQTLVVQGQSDTPLSADGWDQSAQLAKTLDMNQYQLVYSSDLKRAMDTCRSLFPDPATADARILTDIRLRERSMGELQGKSLAELKQAAADAGYSMSNLSKFTPVGGETVEQVGERVREFLNTRVIEEARPNDQVLVVSHGGVIREALRYFKQTLQGDFSCSDKSPLLITPNTGRSVIKLTYSGGGPSEKGKIKSAVCVKLHDVGHLNEDSKRVALGEEQINDSNQQDKQAVL